MKLPADPPAVPPEAPRWPEPRRRFIVQTSGMAMALGVASLLNVLYVTLLAKHLDSASLGVFFCAYSILLIAAAPGVAVQTYITGLFASVGGDDGRAIFRQWGKILTTTGVLLAVGFAAVSVPLARLLKFPSLWPVVATGIAVGSYTLLPLVYGRLQGRQRFVRLGSTLMVEAGTRPLTAFILIQIAALHATSAVASIASGYLVAAVLALFLGWTATASSSPKSASSEGVNSGGLFPTIAALIALSAFAYLDVLFVQMFLGAKPEGPGSLLGGSGSYGVAAFVGRAFMMVTVPLILVMYPKVARATVRGEPAWSFLRDAGVMAMVVWALGFTACATFPTEITGLLFPKNPEAAELIPPFPLAILPYMILTLLTYYLLGRRRWWIALILYAGLLLQWIAAITVWDVRKG
ncbi:MAG: polysaccharide biosynthesis protein [Planctomycetota bacterium]